MNIFYVYMLFREDGRTPFYVGKGSKSRWIRHEKICSRRKTHVDHIIFNMKKNGHTLIKIKVKTGLNEPQALELEKILISSYGREINGGPLVNLTNGGEGISGCKLRFTQDHKKKISAALTGLKKSEDTLKKIREKRVLQYPPPRLGTGKPKIKPLNKFLKKKQFNSKEHNEKISNSLKGRPKSVTWINKVRLVRYRKKLIKLLRVNYKV